MHPQPISHTWFIIMASPCIIKHLTAPPWLTAANLSHCFSWLVKCLSLNQPSRWGNWWGWYKETLQVLQVHITSRRPSFFFTFVGEKFGWRDKVKVYTNVAMQQIKQFSVFLCPCNKAIWQNVNTNRWNIEKSKLVITTLEKKVQCWLIWLISALET